MALKLVLLSCFVVANFDIEGTFGQDISDAPRERGEWGTWGERESCPSGEYAVHFEIRVEIAQGSDDDTALNAICLQCNGGRIICSKEGQWGNMYYSSTNNPRCSNGFTGFRLKYESGASAGRDGDDTA